MNVVGNNDLTSSVDKAAAAAIIPFTYARNLRFGRVRCLAESGEPMKIYLILATAALLSACGTTSSLKLSMSVPKNTSFVLVDDRPLKLKASRVDKYDVETITTIGDDNLDPPPPAIVKTWLSDRLGPKLKNKTVKLTKFDVEVEIPIANINGNNLNTAAESTGAYSNPLALALGGFLVLGINSMTEQKNVRIEIITSIDQHEFSGSSSSWIRGRVTEANVRTTLEAALANLTKEIQTGLQKSVVAVKTSQR